MQETDMGILDYYQFYHMKIEVLNHLESLKRKMKKYAQNFQFEQAALLRDEIIKINGKIIK